MLRADAATLALIALLALLIGGALAPLEALGWWAGWFGQRDDDPPPTPPDPARPPRQHYLVFLSGIHTVSDETFAGRERNLLAALREQLPEVALLEVFPYSVTNRALTGQRVFAWFWRWALRMKLSKAALAATAGMLINLRNLWQVAVSADRRYGSIYNHGTAELIYGALLRAGYPPTGGPRVTLIGYSGGGQIALGAAAPLRERLGAPVTVVSLGGVLAADPALLDVEHLYHLSGRRDTFQRLGNLLFAGRWPILPYSPWNQARARGLISVIDMGPVDHTGRLGYLDSKATLPDGRSHLQQTVDAISAVVRGEADRLPRIAKAPLASDTPPTPP